MNRCATIKILKEPNSVPVKPKSVPVKPKPKSVPAQPKPVPVQPKPCTFMPYWPVPLQPQPISVQPKPADMAPKVIIVPNMNKVIEAIDRVIINKIANKLLLNSWI